MPTCIAKQHPFFFALLFDFWTHQAYLNFRRQSTVGWSIENVWLDLIGGLCTFAQQTMDAYDANDWSVFTRYVLHPTSTSLQGIYFL